VEWDRLGVLGGEEEEGGVKSGPGAARNILLFHIMSASPSKQPRMVSSTLGVYSVGLIFVSVRTFERHHHLLVDRGARAAQMPGRCPELGI
jgi:hypothetical protein